ncbi:DNA topoisomerase [Achlya hypogyna]|uniref:DNA topoisomerase n=1 Tax=Achlya hypogyna TaxID=1202772 RepID=A0A1V9Z583_ACHHY|nr:DNA topoisomerase [Achlya hypogyna]
MRVLNVAEKPSVAKEISAILSQGGCHRRAGFSQYNGIFEFPFQLQNQPVDMVFTSVTGHLMQLDFSLSHRGWKTCDPIDLFTAAVEKTVREDSTQKKIAQTLRAEASRAQMLVLWLDCDREGENIAFEVKAVCEKANRRLRVLRARFSALIPRDIQRAVQSLVQPNENLSLACDARSEIDLRLGAAFTRFQTMRIQKKFPNVQVTSESRVVSFGSCQFPTLGFVVDRFLAIQAFVREPFYHIHVAHTIPDVGSIVFSWNRARVFDFVAGLALFETCVDAQVATVTDVTKKETSKRKPLPLTTVEFQKRASRWLRISSEQAMTAAEALYNRGLLSYPRTETDSFKEGTDLPALLALHTDHEMWGGYVNLLQGGKFEAPRRGSHDDQAHPPIHPTKSVALAAITNDVERRVYEFVVRHFLACCSRDARGSQTSVAMRLADETFGAKGLMILERNYLDIYKYEKWAATTIPVYERGDTFVPTTLLLKAGETAPPPLLTESDLIAKMDQHGIGTDATIAEHINTILKRQYAVKVNNDTQFQPTELGLALVQTYDRMGYQLAKPDLRAAMERDCNAIAQGQKTCEQVVRDCMSQMKTIFESVVARSNVLDETFQGYFGEATPEALAVNSRVVDRAFSACGKCQQPMELRKKSDDGGLLVCRRCNELYALPLHSAVAQSATRCPLCHFQVVEIQKAAGSAGYSVCPHCFNAPPGGRLNEMACYQCTADCPLATGTHEPFVVEACIQCAGASMKLKKTKTAKYVLSCTEYPACKASLWLPAAVAHAMVTTTPCARCSRPNQLVHRVGLRFQTSALPPDVQARVLAAGGRHETCLFCDEVVQDLAQGSLRLQSTAPPPMAATELQSSYQRVARGSAPASDYADSLTGKTKPPRKSATALRASTPQAPRGAVPSCPGHQVECAVRQVRKEGPNKGRFFYTCSYPQGEQCDFFEFTDGPAAASHAPPSSHGPIGDVPLCNHQQPCVKRVVSKAGANVGREFYVCSFPQADSCGFFEWKDGEGAGTYGSSGGPGSNGGGSYARAAANRSTAGGAQRVCQCGEIATELTSKSAANPGRRFYKCPKPDKAEQCKYFEWGD